MSESTRFNLREAVRESASRDLESDDATVKAKAVRDQGLLAEIDANPNRWWS